MSREHGIPSVNTTPMDPASRTRPRPFPLLAGWSSDPGDRRRRHVRLTCVIVQLACIGCGARVESEKEASAPASRFEEFGLPSNTLVKLKQMRTIEDFDRDIAQFESVFWDPQDTVSLRQLIREQSLKGKTVLEIGTGTGLISLCCIQAGAESVVATDINPSAIANAIYNAELLGLEERLDARLVSKAKPSAFSVIDASRRFDLIISNPPWEDGKPDKFADYAYYDKDFALLDSLLKDLERHLEPGGKAWLAYGCVEAIKTTQRLAEERALDVAILDDRRIDELDELFLPGLLLEVKPRGDDEQ